MSYLPEDIHYEIISCFPERIRVVFRTVCKSWALKYRQQVKKYDQTRTCLNIIRYWSARVAVGYALKANNIQACQVVFWHFLHREKVHVVSRIIRERLGVARPRDFDLFTRLMRAGTQESVKLQIIKETHTYISPRNHLRILRGALENQLEQILEFYAGLCFPESTLLIPVNGHAFPLIDFVRNIYSGEPGSSEKVRSDIKLLIHHYDKYHRGMTVGAAKIIISRGICDVQCLHDIAQDISHIQVYIARHTIKLRSQYVLSRV